MLNFFFKQKNRILIVLIIIVSFLTASFLNKNVFLANSPKLNPFFIPNTLASIKNTFFKTTNFFASIFMPAKKTQPINFVNQNVAKFQPIEKLDKEILEALEAPLKKVSKGTYAGEKNGIKIIEIRTDELGYIEKTFIINGKEVKILFPPDITPPPQEVIEKSLQR